MLAQLRIKNLAIVQDVRVEFGKGLNVVTGQTGAGKSILLSAISLITGKKASADIIRSGEESCTIEVSFEFSRSKFLRSFCLKNDLDCEDGILCLRRVVNRDGRNRCFVNGTLVNTSFLRKMADGLIDIHSQHDAQSLLKSNTHIDLLDSMGKLVKLREEVYAAFEAYRRLLSEHKELFDKQSDKEKRLDWLNYQFDELQGAELKADEEESLLEEKNVAAHSSDIHRLAGEFAEQVWAEEASTLACLRDLSKKLQLLADIDKRFAQSRDVFASGYYQIQDAAAEVKDIYDGLSFNPARIEAVNERLFLYHSLQKKYNRTAGELIRLKDELSLEIHMLSASDVYLEDLGKKIAAAKKRLNKLCEGLSAERNKAAKKLDKNITSILGDLGMKHAEFKTSISRSDFNPKGYDHVEFMLAANVGEGLKHLKDIVSGGEASRVLLAIKKALGDADPVPVSIFDEIDSNIGGEIALSVGRKLKEVAATRQVICVTHLPQIACLGDTHLGVVKKTFRGRTQMVIEVIEGEDRVEEMARMLGGRKLTTVTRQHARELLRGSVRA